MSEQRYGRSRRSGSRRRRRRRINVARLAVLILIIVLLAVGIFFVIRAITRLVRGDSVETSAPESSVTESVSSDPADSTATETQPAATAVKEDILSEAQKLSQMYDYDKAIELIRSEEALAEDADALDAISRYEQQKAACVEKDISQVTHIFFHTLVYDTSKAFDGDSKATGYNQVMTTVDEFNKILQQMYDRGYVLVRLHDMAYEEVSGDGTKTMKAGSIMLPQDKKPFVMSEDDVCYYEYMKGDGMATRMIVGEDGRPTNEYTESDGSISVGAYDLVPLLDAFIDEHPDFSYRGAKAAIAFTGYNGILGYRTDESYDPSSPRYDSKLADAPNSNIEADRQEAVKVLKALVDDGYELASHSWGHLDMGAISYEKFKTDSDRWDSNVNSLIEEATGAPCDIIIYPKGADIGSWQGYTPDKINSDGSHATGTQKFNYLYSLGFRYYCNVDSNQPWVQLGTNYLRQGRLNADGDRMWRDMQNPDKAKLTDFYDVKSVFDPARPTPVPGY